MAYRIACILTIRIEFTRLTMLLDLAYTFFGYFLNYCAL